ncbi:Non-functional target of rapamycin complex subunit LST8-2 [Arabidopsis thaliana]|uniref:Target of rapamycin complex subunit LST8 n=2 Tax=Arabidopsis TaxID=3701 RepID=A0A178VY34_ARATH|nr:WD40-repeat-containing domain [Arabidopsis thaliana x Arabidopsis arenosa]OAP11220.1 LST8-2 [Arabidopsis thaliana]
MFENKPDDSPVYLATASHDQTIRLWQARTGRCYFSFRYPDLHVNRLELTPEKGKLVAACNPHIRLFDLRSYNPHIPVRNFVSHTKNVMAVGFQYTGHMMYSGSEDGSVKIWDLRVRECQREFRSVSPVNTVVLHPNQTELISGDQNGNIRVWDLRADLCSCELVPEVGTPIRSLMVMWDGTMVVAANDRGTCYVWRSLCERQTMTEFEPLHKLQAHNNHILKCLLSPGNKYLATASSDKTVKIWNLDGFKLEKVLTGHERWVWDCDFSMDGEYLVTASSDTTARLWSMRAGKEEMVYQAHRKATVCCTLLRD